MTRIMLAPIARGVFTRRDKPETPDVDESIHDQLSQDAGHVGNPEGYPVLSMFDGEVVTAGTYKGYGLAVRVEGVITVRREIADKIARVPWPWQQLRHNAGGTSPEAPEAPYVLPVRVLYGHHSELWVRQGQDVLTFQPLGGMGNTGLSRGVHLHVKMRLLDLPEPLCFVCPRPIFIYNEVP